MKRRELIQGAAALGVTSLLGGMSPAIAQDSGAFRKVRKEVPRSTPGKIDVVEFFWYGCIHCYNFEPLFEDGVLAPPRWLPRWVSRANGLAGVLAFSLFANRIRLDRLSADG